MPLLPRGLLAGLVLIHVLAGAAMGLSVDEAHYLLYALRPALSYFDHPPLVGWVQWPLVAAQVPDTWLRVLPALVWALTLAGAYRLTWEVLQSQASTAPLARAGAAWALAALALAPLLHVLGLGLLPDTLLMAWTVAVMASTWQLMQLSPDAGLRHWLRLGVLLGLAGLSKYTAIFAAFAVLVCLLQAQGWRLLRQRGPWLACALALLLVAPVLLWNAQNQWVSFTYQAQHGSGGGWKGLEFVRFVIVQLLAYGPLVLLGVVGWRVAPRPVRSLAWFALIPLGVLAGLSGGGTSLPHWTAPAWVAAAPLIGLGLAWAAQRGWRSWLLGVAALQALLCAGLVALMLWAGWPLVPSSDEAVAPAPNPFADLYGWQEAGPLARSLAQREGLPALAVQNWTLASRLGWYARPLPVQVLEDRFTQFSLWSEPMAPGGDALLVDWSHMAYDVPMAPHGFTRCRLLQSLPVQHQGRPLASFRFYACYGWEGAPAPVLTRGAKP